MKLHIRYRQLDPDTELQRQVVRRVQFALSRFTHAIREVHVTLADINGPRGGIDKICRVRVVGPVVGAIVVQEAADDVTVALDGAVARVARTTARTLDRRRLLGGSSSTAGVL